MARMHVIERSEAQAVMDGLHEALEKRLSVSSLAPCPVEFTAAFVGMCATQSCGKCTPCREGNPWSVKILERMLSGKGEAFSPTDLCATAVATCIMTIMGIYGQEHGVDVTGTEMEITKIMSANPRRIGKIEVVFKMPARPYSAKEKASLERCASSCPVHLSLHPEVEQVFTFLWQDAKAASQD